MRDDLIRRSTVLGFLDNALRMSTDEKETEILMGVRAGIVGIATTAKMVDEKPKPREDLDALKGLEKLKVLGVENPDWELYTEYIGDEPYRYRYGPEWVAMQLMMEGGYPTPEEAKLAWLREWEREEK